MGSKWFCVLCCSGGRGGSGGRCGSGKVSCGVSVLNVGASCELNKINCHSDATLILLKIASALSSASLQELAIKKGKKKKEKNALSHRYTHTVIDSISPSW